MAIAKRPSCSVTPGMALMASGKIDRFSLLRFRALDFPRSLLLSHWLGREQAWYGLPFCDRHTLRRVGR